MLIKVCFNIVGIWTKKNLPKPSLDLGWDNKKIINFKRKNGAMICFMVKFVLIDIS